MALRIERVFARVSAFSILHRMRLLVVGVSSTGRSDFPFWSKSRRIADIAKPTRSDPKEMSAKQPRRPTSNGLS
jgi:hypothetical protein